MKPDHPRKERRCKAFTIDPEWLIASLNAGREYRSFSLPVMDERFPPDAFVESVIWNDWRRSFAIIVWSSEYPIVPDGAETPFADNHRIEIVDLQECEIMPKAVAVAGGDWSGGGDPIEDIKRANEYAMQNVGICVQKSNQMVIELLTGETICCVVGPAGGLYAAEKVGGYEVGEPIRRQDKKQPPKPKPHTKPDDDLIDFFFKHR